MKRICFVLIVLLLAFVLIPASALADVSADYGWYSETKTVYTLSCAADLVGFANIANGTAEGIAETDFAGKTIKLAADIDLGGMLWTPIKSFKGEFNGNNKTISNFEIVVGGNNIRGGFFNGIEAGGVETDADGNIIKVIERVHDLTLKGVKATVNAVNDPTKEGRFGTLANYIEGVVNRVTVEDVEVTTTDPKAWVGGMCAFMSWPWMNDCTVKNLVVNAEKGAAFIAGFSPILQKNSNMVFDNCDVNGFKVIVNGEGEGCGVGGFAGQTQRGWENPKMTNCDVTGIDITAFGKVEIGGFIAWPGAHTIAENCTTKGKIDASGVTGDYGVGGFFGNLGWNCNLGQKGHQIINCTANVDIITGGAPAGGFIGAAMNSNNSSMYASFDNCTAKGNVTNSNGAAGGFAGKADRGDYTGCKATGDVTGTVAGGFFGQVVDTTPAYDNRFPEGTIGYPPDQITLDSCRSEGFVLASEKAGGLIGEVCDKVANTAATDGKLIVKGSAASPVVAGTKPNTVLAMLLNKTDNHKDLDLSGNTDSKIQVLPKDDGTKLSVENGVISVPADATLTINGADQAFVFGGLIKRNADVVVYDKPMDEPIPTTGDTSKPLLWATLIFIASAGLAINMGLRRKLREE